MRENNRKPIENCRKKLPQFTTMNVIDGQAGLAIYSSLIFYSLTIDNILNIIVLLILAAVAINLTIGNNGILRRTELASEKWKEASENEQKEMDEVGNFIGDYINNKNNNSEFNTGKTVEEAKKQDKFFEKDTTITDSSQPANNVRIPEGFKIANDSATIVEDGIVIEDKVGNQFVWIPAKTDSGTVVHTSKGDVIMVYKRTDFGKNNGSYNDYSEIMLNDEKTSINNNGGYYIGRYEAGDKQSTNAKTMRKSVSNKTNTITIKKNQVPYNYISYEDADKLAKEMKKEQGYKATTKLTSSYAWDTTISFIQIKNEDYGINSEEGNYYNTTFEYTDIIEKNK